MVAAVLRRGNRILITRRHAHGDRGGQWEFPGGKVESGESEAAALAREIREELGCDVEVGAVLARTTHRYPDLEVELAFYECALPEGAEPRLIGAAEMAWADASHLGDYDFCEADRPLLPEIAFPRGRR